MAKTAPEPIEVWPLASYLAEEMEARDWTTDDVAKRMGGELWRDCLVVATLLSVQEDNLIVGDDTFIGLSLAFDVSEDLFRNLDQLWRDYPDRREPFEAPDRLFGPLTVSCFPKEGH